LLFLQNIYFSRRQLGELDVITERLKSRYYSASEISSTSRSSSTIPPSSTLTINSTTIEKDSIESLNGKPLISNGLNVTDAHSLHNDQVRLAQELMTKANHLLETSKDFFNKPSSIPSTIMEKTSTPPPILPNFNTIDNLSQINRNSFEEKHQIDSMIWSDLYSTSSHLE
jgi:hypothetical protein